MLYPPSLPQAVLSRSFRSANNELGILPSDVGAFLDACQSDAVNVLGWELWLVNHHWDAASDEPTALAGRWCGLIPVRGQTIPSVFSFEGDLKTTREQLAGLDLDKLVEPRWLNCLRVNLTIG